MCKWTERYLIIDKSSYIIEEEDIEKKMGGLEKSMDVISKDLIYVKKKNEEEVERILFGKIKYISLLSVY